MDRDVDHEVRRVEVDEDLERRVGLDRFASEHRTIDRRQEREEAALDAVPIAQLLDDPLEVLRLDDEVDARVVDLRLLDEVTEQVRDAPERLLDRQLLEGQLDAAC